MQRTLEKIQSFADFEAGWSYGEGVTFSRNTLDKAVQLAKTAHTLGFHETDAFPGLNGEIMVTVYQGNEYWEFTLQPAETITFVYERDDEMVTYEEGLPFEFAVSLLTNLAFHHHHLFAMQRSTPVPARSLSVSLTPSTTTRASNALPALLSRIPLAVVSQ